MTDTIATQAVTASAIALIGEKMAGDISGAQLASLSAELRHWLDRTDPPPLDAEMRCRAAMTLLEHGSRGRTVATQALIAAIQS